MTVESSMMAVVAMAGRKIPVNVYGVLEIPPEILEELGPPASWPGVFVHGL